MAEPVVDDFSPLYRQVRDSFDGTRWRSMAAEFRRPERIQSSQDVGVLVDQIAPEYGVDPALVKSVIGLESGGQAGAVSHKGAQGLMQLMPGTAQRFGVQDPFDPVQNITGGVRYLAYLQAQFPGRVDLQLAAYHAGEGAVKAAGGIPNTNDRNMMTAQYVQTILGRYQQLRPLPGEGGRPGVTITAPMQGTRPGTPYQSKRDQANPPPGLSPTSQADLATALQPSGTPYQSRREQGQPLPGLSPASQEDVGTALALPPRPAEALSAVRPGDAPAGPAFMDVMQPPPDPISLETLGGQFRRGLVELGGGQLLQTLSNIPRLAEQFGNTLAAVTGLPAGGALVGPLTTALQDLSTRLTHDPQLALDAQTFSGQLAQAVGAAIPGLGTALVASTLGGPTAGFAALGALEHAHEGAAAMATGAVQNVLLGAFLHATQALPTPLRLAAGGGAFGGLAAAETGDPRQALIQGLIGSALALPGPARQQIEETVPGLQEFVTQERATRPDFTVIDALHAALAPDHPPADVPLPTWQRWAQKMLDLLPEPSTAPIRGGFLTSETGAISMQPTVRTGAEGVPQDRYRTSSGDWRIPLREMPSQELELQDFIRQQGGVKLQGEELQGELTALLSRKETGMTGLQNNTSGLTAQQLAERAQEQGFLPTADKQSLLDALDRSVTQGQPVYSHYATGHVPILDDPHVQASYQAVLDAVEAMRPRTEEAVGGVRHRVDVHTEARTLIDTGQFTLDDVRELYPNTALNDTMASALVQTLHTLGTNLVDAGRAFLDSGARVGSREEQHLQQIMALFAEVDPQRLGVSAAQSRALGILNDPLSGYTQFLNGLHQTLLTAPERTMESIATKIVGLGEKAAGREALQQQLVENEAAIAQRMREASQGPMTPPEPRRPGTFEFQTDWLSTLETQQLADIQARLAAQGFFPPRPSGHEEQLGLGSILPPEPIQHTLLSEQDVLADRAVADQMRGELRDLFTQWQTERQGRDALKAQDAVQAQKILQDWLDAHAPADTAARLSGLLRPWEQRQTQLELFQTLTQAARPGFQEYFLELYFNAMFSNPSTHVANALGNMVTTVWAIPERFIAEQYGRGSEQGVARGEATAMLYGLVHGIQDAWAGAVRSWQAGEAVTGLSKGEVRPPAVTAGNLGLNPESALGRFADFWFNYIGMPLWPGITGGRLPTRALMASDEFFKIWNYRSELNALAYREATRQGYDGPAFAEHVARVVSSPNLGQLQQTAKDFSILQTFQKTLSPQSLGAGLQALANFSVTVPRTDQTFPVGRLLIPIIQTPANIARYATERTPVGFLYQNIQADLRAGGERANLAAAKVTLGTLVMAAAAGLAMSGRLVGRGPTDPELREIWLEMHPENSVRLPGGTWLAIDRLDPIGMPMLWMADMIQIGGEASMPGWERALAAPLFGFLRNMGSRTWMQGLSSFFDAMSPRPFERPGTSMGNIGRFMAQRGASLLRPSQLEAATARVLSPEEVNAQDMIDALYARIPGWSGFGRSGVPARRTLGGEKVLLGYGFDPELLANTVRAYWPMKLGEGVATRADKAILDNKMQLSKPPQNLQPQALPPGMQAVAATDVDPSELQPLHLTPQQYERYQVLAAGNQAEAHKLGLVVPDKALQDVVAGLSEFYARKPPATVRTLGQFLDWVTTTPEFHEASPGPGGGKEEMFQRAVREYRSMGRELLLAQDPALEGQYEQSRVRHQVQRLPLGQRPAVLQQLQAPLTQLQRERRQIYGLQVGATP